MRAPVPFAIAELLRPSAFAHPVTQLDVRETNISWVVLTGPFAYKIKKSVQFEFIDASTLAERKHLCEEELRLNRRLAAGLYLGVVAITLDADGLRVGGHGSIVEYAVQMQQFDASQELPALLERRDVSPPEMANLAHRLADFHAAAARAEFNADCPHTAHLHDAVLGNLATLLSHLGAATLPPEMGCLIDWIHDYLHNSQAALRAREQCGAIRECHGDLHARNIVRWHGELVPFDCLDFDPKLRWIDVMNDVAFLAMDLTARDRRDLASAFLNAYLERSGDYDGVRHLAFYSVYRALVRAMVDSIGAEQDPEHGPELRNRLRMRVMAAAAYIKRPAPALIITHGPSGSGKSWLSGRLATQLGAIRIRSDVERKRLSGIPAETDSSDGYQQGIYAPEVSRRTYARLFESARSCLTGGLDVIVDAAFLDGAQRRKFRDLAEAEGLGFIILTCEAESSVLAQRIQARSQQRTDASDAGLAVLSRQLLSQEPLSAQELGCAIAIDTAQPQACHDALAAIQERIHAHGSHRATNINK